MTSKNSDHNRDATHSAKDENESKTTTSPGNKNSERDGDYGGSDFGRVENVNEDWQAGATEYDMNFRGQGFSSSGQSEKSMGVEKVAHAGEVPNSDELIYEEVHMLLEHQPDLDASTIELTVKNGEVLLEGTVRTPIDNRHLDEAIKMVAGVQNVENRLRILEDTAPVEDGD